MAQTKNEIDARYYQKNKEIIKAKYPYISIAEISEEARLKRNAYQRQQHRIRKAKSKCGLIPNQNYKEFA